MVSSWARILVQEESYFKKTEGTWLQCSSKDQAPLRKRSRSQILERGELRQMLWSSSTEERGKAAWKMEPPTEVAGFTSVGSKEERPTRSPITPE